MTSDRQQKKVPILALAALGVVFGDIGTSPLYAFRIALETTPGAPRVAVFGILSLIIWSLIVIICIKYALLILRADNRGEGGILAMLPLLGTNRAAWLTITAIIGAALLYGDGAITPAISVLSALEGATVSAPGLRGFIVPTAIVILFGLFAIQHRGSGAIGRLFGPVMLVWFLAIGIAGAVEVVRNPSILEVLSPWEAVAFVRGSRAATILAVLGAVFLAVTGGEAMYADMGHFGRAPTRTAWFVVVLPAILLNYLGQGAIVLRRSAAATNPFYALAPGWLHYPMVALATIATIIASQAIISGVFSLTQQSIRLKLLPHLRIAHTSSQESGQIFVPVANAFLAVATLVAVLMFRSSSALAGAYGIAVSGLMAISTLLAARLARRWRYPLAVLAIVNGTFLLIDLTFVAANLMKVPQGGWYPLCLAALVATVMLTWRRGLVLVEAARSRMREDEAKFADGLDETGIVTLAGTGAFLTASERGIPLTLTHQLGHIGALPGVVLLVSVLIEEEPRIPLERSVYVGSVANRDGIHRILLRFGFMEDINVPERLHFALSSGELTGLPSGEITYFLGHETIIADRETPGMTLWRESLFVALQRATTPTAASFGIPPSSAIIIGLELKI